MKTFYIKTYGCQMNEYDSSRIVDLLQVKHKMKEVDSSKSADLLLLITCAIREKAQEKVFSELGRWKKLKEKNPDIIIGVGGCVASLDGKSLCKRAPYVDIVFGPQTIHRVGTYINQIMQNQNKLDCFNLGDSNNENAKKSKFLNLNLATKNNSKIINTDNTKDSTPDNTKDSTPDNTPDSTPGNTPTNTNTPIVDLSFPEIEKFCNLPKQEIKNKSAYVTIMEGCNNFCTYCVVPYTRGAEISRPFDDIIAECKHLAENGVLEVTLLGQNVNSYQYKSNNGKTYDLASIINHIAKFYGLERIRFMTSNPMKCSDNIIDCYKNIPKLANHIHLPVQSGSNKILTQMNRDYTREKYTSIINKLREVRPNISVASDFIVGFPGETDEDFNDTIRLVEDLNFDQSFSFIYSPRPKTKAATFVDDIPKDIKKQRLQILQKTLTRQAHNITKEMIGTTQNILVSGYSKKCKDMLIGKTENNRAVIFKGCSTMIGKIIPIKITNASDNILEGENQ